VVYLDLDAARERLPSASPPLIAAPVTGAAERRGGGTPSG